MESFKKTKTAKKHSSLIITRSFITKDFQCALDCINVMGEIAERESHHPNLHLTDYRSVKINIWTHKLGGITEADLTSAWLFDKEVKIVYSPKWLRGHPEAKSTASDQQ